MITPEWTGETCFIIGCGPSLRSFDASVLKGRRVIVINDSYKLVPNADVLYFCDMRWWKSRKFDVDKVFNGRYIITLENKLESDGVMTMKNTGRDGLEFDPSGLRHGSNSGFQAIGLAYHFGVKRIVLLGYDMQIASDHMMHFNHRPENQNPHAFQQTLNIMKPHFDTIKKPLEDAGVEVINATPNSALKTWTQTSLDEAIASFGG